MRIKWIEKRLRASRIRALQRRRITGTIFDMIMQQDPTISDDDAEQLAYLAAEREMRTLRPRVNKARALLAIRMLRRRNEISMWEAIELMDGVDERYRKEIAARVRF